MIFGIVFIVHSLHKIYIHYLNLPTVSHFLSGMLLPWAHFANNGLLWHECMFTICCRNDLNLANITRPFPSNVEVALQCRWFSIGLIQSCNASQSFSLAILESTFLISVCNRTSNQKNYVKKWKQWQWNNTSSFIDIQWC